MTFLRTSPLCRSILAWSILYVSSTAATGVALSGRANADTIGITPASFEVYATSPTYSTSALLAPGLQTNGGCIGSGCASDKASLYYSYGQIVENVSGYATGHSTAYSISRAVYYFEIVPDSVSQPINLSIPVILTLSSQAAATDYSGSSSSGSYANGQVQWPGGDFFSCAASGDANCNGEPTSFSISQTTRLYPFLAYDLIVQAYGYSDLAGTYGALIDPEVEISPTFAEAGDYHLVFSANVGGSAISEPSTWALLVLGFIGLGAVWQRGPRRNRLSVL